MAPRFVELLSPVEEGFVWVSFFHSNILMYLQYIVNSTTLNKSSEYLDTAFDYSSSSKIVEDVDSIAKSVFYTLPESCKVTKYFLLAAILSALFRFLYVCWKSHYIMQNYGTSKKYDKEL
jgi:hypothetical protein